MRINKIYLFLILIFFSSCTFYTSSMKVTPEDGNVAKDFKSFQGTLLIIENRDFADNALNRIIEKRFKNNYKGEYEVISEEVLKSSKSYQDKKKNRYVIQLQVGNKTASTARFKMLDRKDNSEYFTKYYASWTEAINKYSAALEKLRNE